MPHTTSVLLRELSRRSRSPVLYSAARNFSRTPMLAALGTCASSQLRLRYCIIESVLSCAMCVIVLEWVRKGYLRAGRFPGASFSAWKWEITWRCSGKKREVGGCKGRVGARGSAERGRWEKGCAGRQESGTPRRQRGYGSVREALAQ